MNWLHIVFFERKGAGGALKCPLSHGRSGRTEHRHVLCCMAGWAGRCVSVCSLHGRSGWTRRHSPAFRAGLYRTVRTVPARQTRQEMEISVTARLASCPPVFTFSMRYATSVMVCSKGYCLGTLLKFKIF
jgi:hypothetical protein